MKLQQLELAPNAGKKASSMTAGLLLVEESSAVENAHFADIDGSLWKNISETSIKRLDIQFHNDYD